MHNYRSEVWVGEVWEPVCICKSQWCEGCEELSNTEAAGEHTVNTQLHLDRSRGFDTLHLTLNDAPIRSVDYFLGLRRSTTSPLCRRVVSCFLAPPRVRVRVEHNSM